MLFRSAHFRCRVSPSVEQQHQAPALRVQDGPAGLDGGGGVLRAVCPRQEAPGGEGVMGGLGGGERGGMTEVRRGWREKVKKREIKLEREKK